MSYLQTNISNQGPDLETACANVNPLFALKKKKNTVEIY